jgi:tryptophan-rich hypothetical protein
MQARYSHQAMANSLAIAKSINAMPSKDKNLLSPKKLLLSKWTAVHPVQKRKHFLVSKVIAPEPPEDPIEYVELEAVFDHWAQIIPWRQLSNKEIWRQGWV